MGQLAEEDEVSVLGRDAQGAWLYVRTAQALNGWLPAFALELSTPVDIMDLALVERACGSRCGVGAGIVGRTDPVKAIARARPGGRA